MSKKLSYVLGSLQIFIGVGAVAGGMWLILESTGKSLGAPIEWLEQTPFSSFMIPGIVLFTINGMGSLAGAIANFTGHLIAGEIAMGLGIFLVAWIGIQGYWFAGFHWLHWLYLGLGLSEIVLGWTTRVYYRQNTRSL